MCGESLLFEELVFLDHIIIQKEGHIDDMSNIQQKALYQIWDQQKTFGKENKES